MPSGLITLRAGGLGGIDERWAAEAQNAAVLQDARRDPRGGWTRCGGYRAILEPVTDPKDGVSTISAFLGEGKIHSMHWVAHHNGGIQYLLFEMGSQLVYFNGSTQSWEVLASDRYETDQPWQRTQYVSVGNNTWIINGQNAPLRFDGERLHRAGFDGPPAAPTARCINEGFVCGSTLPDMGLGAASTYDDGGHGLYAWVRTLVNEFGTESPPSAASNVVTWADQPLEDIKDNDANVMQWADVGGSRYFADLDLPDSNDEGAVASRLYRTRDATLGTLNYGTTYHFLREIKTKTRIKLIDVASDAALLSPLDPMAFGPWPKGAKYIVSWQGCTWAAGMPEYPDRLARSAPLQSENFPPGNIYTIGGSDSGEITGLYASKNVLFVFTRRAVFIVVGNPVSGFEPRDFSNEDGCDAPNSIREIPGAGVVFASRLGVYLIPLTEAAIDVPGSRPVRISRQVDDFWRNRVTHTALMNAYGRVYRPDEEYVLLLPVDGQPENSVALVFHYAGGRADWSFRPKQPFACAVESHDHRRCLFMGSNDDEDHPGVHVYSPGWPDKDGEAIEFKYETTPLEYGLGKYENFSVKTVQVWVLGYGNTDVRLDYYIDRRQAKKNATQKRRDAQDPTYQIPVWGKAKWSATETWYKHRPIPIRFDIDATCREFAFHVEPESRIQIIDWELGIKPGPTREIRTLNTAIPTGTAPNK